MDGITEGLKDVADEQRRGHAEVLQRFDDLPDKFVSREVADLRYEQTNARLSHIESSKEWLIRTIGVLIIAEVLSALYILPKVAG